MPKKRAVKSEKNRGAIAEMLARMEMIEMRQRVLCPCCGQLKGPLTLAMFSDAPDPYMAWVRARKMFGADD